MPRQAIMYVKRYRRMGILIFLLFLLFIGGLFFIGHRIGDFDPVIKKIVNIDETRHASHVLTIITIKGEANKVLVPEGMEDSDSTSEVHATIDLLWETSPRGESHDGILEISIVSIYNKNNVDVSHIISVELASSMMISSNITASLPIVIKMDEPEDKEAYDLVANQTIYIKLEFNVKRN